MIRYSLFDWTRNSLRMARLTVVAALAFVACARNDDVAVNASSTPRTVQVAPPPDTTRMNDSIAASIAAGVTAVVPSDSAWPSGAFDTLYNKPLDSKYTLLATRARSDVSHRVTVRLQLVSRGTSGQVRDIALLNDGDIEHHIVRVDSEAIVISRFDSHGMAEANSKLFLDAATRNLIKQFAFPAAAGLAAISDGEVANVLGIPDSVVRALKKTDPSPNLPEAMQRHPMPSSTYADFARARPERVKQGYGPDAGIGESLGPFQIEGQRVWFAKTFYDGEGESGVGGAGVFDTTTSQYTFLKIPELAPWSASAILFDDQTLWIGMVDHPEGGDYGGGLLRHDLRTGATKRYQVPDVIKHIKRRDGRTFVATTGGVVVIESDRIVARYAVEPDLKGKLVLVKTAEN